MENSESTYQRQLESLNAAHPHLRLNEKDLHNILKSCAFTYEREREATAGFDDVGLCKRPKIRSLKSSLRKAVALICSESVRNRIIIARAMRSKGRSWTVYEEAENYSELFDELTSKPDGMALLLSNFYDLVCLADFPANKLKLQYRYLPRTTSVLLEFWLLNTKIKPTLSAEKSLFTDFVEGCHKVLGIPFSREAVGALDIKDLQNYNRLMTSHPKDFDYRPAQDRKLRLPSRVEAYRASLAEMEEVIKFSWQRIETSPGGVVRFRKRKLRHRIWKPSR